MFASSAARRSFLALGCVALLSGCITQKSDSPDHWIKAMNNRPATKSTIYVCHAFGCKLKYTFRPTSKDIAKLKSILAKGKRSPEAERKAIGNAVVWFEKRVGPLMGSDKDKGGLDMHNSGVPGQMDCIDEASNTTSLIVFAEKHGLLTHYTVQSPVARGFFLDGRYPHATAVIKEKKSGKRYAVDSWLFDNGVFPAIKPLHVWMSESPSSR
ncbi:hypothetical protein [uncultured Cohaesibacter sp.]|uniref:hypothetical protein n=1 Tax=uncultured Cohaesibacter sp. TaxID=1002546 RepID=UPI0029C7ACA2|nr:hypothetical protein [uncultured Cohaesibacter sp.]